MSYTNENTKSTPIKQNTMSNNAITIHITRAMTEEQKLALYEELCAPEHQPDIDNPKKKRKVDKSRVKRKVDKSKVKKKFQTKNYARCFRKYKAPQAIVYFHHRYFYHRRDS